MSLQEELTSTHAGGGRKKKEEEEEENRSWASKLRYWWSEVTIEPAIFLYVVSGGLAYGAGQQSKLLLWKACNVIKGYNSTICDNLSDKANDAVENEIQIYTNNFSITDSMLSSWPAIFYVFFAGALSDKFGRKWLICLPVTGILISTVFQIVHYAFIWDLPMEFFYLDNWHAYMGSYPMYYLGFYAYASDVSSPARRAHRMAAYDGTEMVGYFVGTLGSPYLFNATGYYGIYITRLVMVVAALAYWLKYIKSPEELGVLKKDEKDEKAKEAGEEEQVSFATKYVLTPARELYRTLSRRRPRGLRALLYLNFLVYFLYITTVSYNGEKYMYMVKVFDDFSGERYAQLGAIEKAVAIFSLIVLLPFFLTRLGWHETALAMAICSIQIISLTCAAFAQNMFPQLALAMAVSSVDVCQWALVRAVFTKMVDKDEVGKVFSFVGILASSLTLFAVPAMKKLYNATLAIFPSTFLLVAAGMYAAAMAANLVLFCFRGRFSLAGAPAIRDDAGAEGAPAHKDENGNELLQKKVQVAVAETH